LLKQRFDLKGFYYYAVRKNMADFLLKTGMFLMLFAGMFIIGAFCIFIFFAFLMILPGLLIYNTGIKMIYKDVIEPRNNSNDENVITIEGRTEDPDPVFVHKGKKIMRGGARKVRNFLNKYAD